MNNATFSVPTEYAETVAAALTAADWDFTADELREDAFLSNHVKSADLSEVVIIAATAIFNAADADSDIETMNEAQAVLNRNGACA